MKGQMPPLVSQHDWEIDKEQEDEGVMHPCTEWDPLKCDCKGACSCHFAKYKMETRTAEVFEITVTWGRGCRETVAFSVDQQEGCYRLGIEGAYGGYAFAWTHPGGCFYSFLARLDHGYVSTKMVGRDEVFDGKGTADAIRKEIWLARRSYLGKPAPGYYGDSMVMETARDEWDMVPDEFESEVEFNRWMEDTEFFRDDEPWHFWQVKEGPRAHDFRYMYERFWPAFAAEMRKRSAAKAA